MTRPSLNLALLTTFIFTIISLAARAFGSTQPPNPALLGFTEGCEDQPQPCWYGIVPGVTELWAAREQVQSWGGHEYSETISASTFDPNTISIGSRYSIDSCYTLLHSTQPCIIVEYIIVSDCRELEMGDLINQFGLSQTIQFRNGVWGDMEEFSFMLDDDRKVFNPRTKPSTMIIPSRDNTTAFFSWHGFAPHRRYCQFEPENYTCP